MKQLLWMELHMFKRVFFYGLFLILVLFELSFICMNSFFKVNNFQNYQCILILIILALYPLIANIKIMGKKSRDYFLTLPIKRFYIFISPFLVAVFGSALLFLINIFLIKFLPLPELKYGLTLYEIFLNIIPLYYSFFIFLIFLLFWSVSSSVIYFDELNSKFGISVLSVANKTAFINIFSVLLFITILLLTNNEAFLSWYTLIWISALGALAFITFYVSMNFHCRYPTSLIKTTGLFMAFYFMLFIFHSSSAYADLWSNNFYNRYLAFHTYFKIWPSKVIESYRDLFKQEGNDGIFRTITQDIFYYRKGPYPLEDLWKGGINSDKPLRKAASYSFIAIQGPDIKVREKLLKDRGEVRDFLLTNETKLLLLTPSDEIDDFISRLLHSEDKNIFLIGVRCTQYFPQNEYVIDILEGIKKHYAGSVFRSNLYNFMTLNYFQSYLDNITIKPLIDRNHYPRSFSLLYNEYEKWLEENGKMEFEERLLQHWRHNGCRIEKKFSEMNTLELYEFSDYEFHDNGCSYNRISFYRLDYRLRSFYMSEKQKKNKLQELTLSGEFP